MGQDPYRTGSVYVLSNPTAGRTKVGMTGIGANDVPDRLRDINDMWIGRKVTCQICAGHLVNTGGLVPRHVKSGTQCIGGGALPLETSVALAQKHLVEVQGRIPLLAGAAKGSAVRIARTLARRVERFRRPAELAGEWQFLVAYFTDEVAEVEARTHHKLSAFADQRAPFGEVFCCTAEQAAAAVEAVLSELGLLHSAIKRTCLTAPPETFTQPGLWDAA